MAKLVPSPNDVLDQIRRLVSPPPTKRNEPASIDRILDAAYDAYAEDGVSGTTMTRIARDADVSREWLYRQYSNRDAVAIAVLQREVTRFIDGLARRITDASDPVDVMVDTFVFAVEFLRDHVLLSELVANDAHSVGSHLIQVGDTVVGGAVRAAAGYINVIGGVDLADATVIAETLVRLVLTSVIAPVGAIDLHDADQLRRFAASVVPGVLATAAAQQPSEQGAIP